MALLTGNQLHDTHNANCNINIQLFQERLSEKVHATMLKGIVGSTEWPVLQWNLKEWHESIDVSLWVLKESNKSIFNSYNVRNSVLIVSHITLRDCRVHSFSDNLSQNSCKLTIVVEEALICWLVFLCNRWCTSFWHFQLDLIAICLIRVLNLKVNKKKIQDPFAVWNKLYCDKDMINNYVTF